MIKITKGPIRIWSKRRIVVHCDNRGAEVCLLVVDCRLRAYVSAFGQVAVRRGSARKYDHAQLAHGQWLHAARRHMQLWVQRVHTKSNISDLPSRKVNLLYAYIMSCLLLALRT